MDEAIEIASQADLFVVVGTSLNVYPAAGLVHYTPSGCPIYVIDPERPQISLKGVTFIEEKAGTGVLKLREMLAEKMV